MNCKSGVYCLNLGKSNFYGKDLIISGGGDNTIKVWDAKAGKCLNTLEGHKHFIWAINILQELQIIVSGSQDNTIKFWDIKTGECLKTLAVPRPQEGTNIVGARGLTESEKTSLKLLGAMETKEIRVLPNQEILTSHIPQREAEINIQSLP